jgi:hypothetical protein
MPPKTPEFVNAKDTMQAELMKHLGEKAKVILDNIDDMRAQGKGRDEIEAMMIAEIARHTQENAQELVGLLT